MPRNKNSSTSQRPCQTMARWTLGVALVIYALAMVVLQHQHLNSQSSANDIAALLNATKEAFLGVQSSTSNLLFHDPENNENDDGNNNNSNAATFAAGNTVLSHRPASLILQNPKLPDWVKQYATWHRQQRQRYLHAKRTKNATAAADIKFLLSRCLTNDKCGGASDRLQDMPYNIMLANQTNRVLLVRWEKPAPLENFLVPPAEHGIDWTLQGEMYEYLLEEGDWHLKGKETNDKLKIVSTIRRDSAAPIFRKYENDVVGHKIYHEIFRLLFSPSKALAERVESTMKSLELVPSQYSSVHLRVKYPVKGVDEHTFTFEKHKDQITKWATNAVNCAAELHPNSTIYVSSDNNDTVGYLLEDSHFAKHYIDATRHNKHPLVVKLVARDYSNENEHVAFSNNKEADGFMSVFEDMMIMGMGRCVAHGVGGYGRLGAALSGGECAVAHRGRHSKVCSDALARIQSKIDS